MKIREEKGITGIDVATGIVIFIIASTVILELYYQIYVHTVSIKIHETAIGYITEIFESIDLAQYDDVDTVEEIENNIIKDTIKSPYQYQVEIDKYSEDVPESKDLVERITIKISYNINEKENRSFEMNKIKIRE